MGQSASDLANGSQHREELTMLDVVTVGETQVRFSPKGYQRLDQAHEMEVNAAGAESNVAVAAARLGMRAGWIFDPTFTGSPSSWRSTRLPVSIRRIRTFLS